LGGVSTLTPGIFLKDNSTLLSGCFRITRAFPRASSFSSIFAITLVFGSGIVSPSITKTFSFSALEDNADNSAILRAFFGKLYLYFLGLGPNVIPPPLQMGDTRLPCLALPVPFCRQGFDPPPATSLLVFAFAVPR